MHKFVLIIGLICFPLAAHAQEVFSGLVGDSATFTGLPFVSIRVKNKSTGTTTDINGSFKISATRQDTLILTCVGYKPLIMALSDWEPGIILMTEQVTVLDDITILDKRSGNYYEELFAEQNDALRRSNKKLPFYYTREKKQNIKLGRLANENLRVQTYVNIVIKNEQLRTTLISKYKLTEDEYYDLLGNFNAEHVNVMYYLSAPELLTLINNYFASHAPLK